MRTLAYLFILLAILVSNPHQLLVSRLDLVYVEPDLLAQTVSLIEKALWLVCG